MTNMEEENVNQKKNKSNQLLFGGAAIAVLALSGGYFVLSQNLNIKKPENSALVESVPTQTRDEIEEELENIKTFEIEAGSFYYSVKEIRVTKGDKVRIILEADDMMHDFNIGELSVHGPITKAGETNVIEFTADKTGVFEYYCSVGQHRKMGQVGKIIVE